MNFNDFGPAMVTLFHLLVVNNWFVTCSVYTLAFAPAKWPRIFFISFWINGVLIALNLLVSVIIEIYSTVDDAVETEYDRLNKVTYLARRLKYLQPDELELRIKKYREILNVLNRQENSDLRDVRLNSVQTSEHFNNTITEDMIPKAIHMPVLQEIGEEEEDEFEFHKNVH